MQIVGNIHDAVVAYIDADKVDVLVPQVVEIMSNLPFHKIGWKPQLPFTADAEVGPISPTWPSGRPRPDKKAGAASQFVA